MIGCKWVVLRSGARCAAILRAMAGSGIRDRMQQAGQRCAPCAALWDCRSIELCHCKPLMLCFPAKRTRCVRFSTSESECLNRGEHRDHEAITMHPATRFPRPRLSHLPGMFLGCTFPAITSYSSEMAFALLSPIPNTI